MIISTCIHFVNLQWVLHDQGGEPCNPENIYWMFHQFSFSCYDVCLFLVVFSFQFHNLVFVSFLLLSIFNFMFAKLSSHLFKPFMMSGKRKVNLLMMNFRIWRIYLLNVNFERVSFEGIYWRIYFEGFICWWWTLENLNHLSQSEIAWQLVGLTFCE